MSNTIATKVVNVNFKSVVLVSYYNIMKSQISSTKFQINLKSQYSMTKAIIKTPARRDVKSGEAGMVPLDTMADGSFVWIFEFGSRAAQALAPRVGICLGFGNWCLEFS